MECGEKKEKETLKLSAALEGFFFCRAEIVAPGTKKNNSRLIGIVDISEEKIYLQKIASSDIWCNSNPPKIKSIERLRCLSNRPDAVQTHLKKEVKNTVRGRVLSIPSISHSGWLSHLDRDSPLSFSFSFTLLPTRYFQRHS